MRLEVINLDSELLNISRRIMQILKEQKISYGELSKLTGIPKSALQRYATGETVKIPLDRLESIAEATGTSAAWIMGWDDSPHLLSPTITEDIVTFPVIGEIAAGYDHIAYEDWGGETVDIPASYLRGRPKKDFFVLSVKGDSMYPVYMEGDKVLILRQNTLNRSGEIGAVVYEDNLASLKKVEYVSGEDWMKMIPLNPNYPPVTISGADLELCRILGIPKLIIREVE